VTQKVSPCWGATRNVLIFGDTCDFVKLLVLGLFIAVCGQVSKSNGIVGC
jgi:hypothetical protein